MPERRHGKQRRFPISRLRLSGDGKSAWIGELRRWRFVGALFALLPLDPTGIARLHEIAEAARVPDRTTLDETIQATSIFNLFGLELLMPVHALEPATMRIRENHPSTAASADRETPERMSDARRTGLDRHM